MSIAFIEHIINQFSKTKTSQPYLEFRIVGIIVFLLIVFFSQEASASNRNQLSIYGISESNFNDTIVGIGVSTLHKINNTDVGVSINTSLSNADVVDINGDKQKYLAWELGARVGYFSTLFLYAEVGFDFGELALQDRDEDSYRSSYDTENTDVYYDDNYRRDRHTKRYDYSNDIDAYIGLGAGIDFGHLQLSAFIRYRQIDGEYWKANNQTFSGVKGAISF